MLKTELAKGESEVWEKTEGPTVLFSTEGDGMLKAGGETFEIREGYIFFVGQGVEVELEAGEGLVVYGAYAE